MSWIGSNIRQLRHFAGGAALACIIASIFVLQLYGDTELGENTASFIEQQKKIVWTVGTLFQESVFAIGSAAAFFVLLFVLVRYVFKSEAWKSSSDALANAFFSLAVRMVESLLASKIFAPIFGFVGRLAWDFSEAIEKFLPNLATSNDERRSDILSQNYLSELQTRALISLVALVALCGALWLKHDRVGIFVVAVIGCLIFSHLLLTRYRVRRGLFGSNSQEAYELIAYIIDQTNMSGKPPGTRVSHAYNEAHEPQEVFDAEAAGVRK